jgi:ribosomal-protein-alanine N-acetyltransferase
MVKIPELRTERLLLCEFQPEDAAKLKRILEGLDVLKYFPSDKPPSLERVERLVVEHRDHWGKFGYGWWAIWTRENPTLIGWCGLNFLDETEEIELKYLLDRSYWGQGLATEAALRSVRFGFDTINLQEIIGIVHPKHVASQRVLEKVGMIRVDEAEYFGMHCIRYKRLNQKPSLNGDTATRKGRS